MRNSEPVIRALNVEKKYKSDFIEVPAVAGVSFEVEQGAFCALMGPSGCGKSTLLHILGCLDRPTAGQVFFEGADVTKLSDEVLADTRNKKIGFVFQMFNLLPRMTVGRNVELPLVYAGIGKRERTRYVSATLEELELRKRMDHLPSQISGGERQRAAIARALISSPSIILADEPTGNLDSKTSEVIMGLFKRLNREGATLFVVTHDPQVASYAGRVFHMKDGLIS
jgi:putative ABC transport system ATP-binding protein